MNSGYIRAGLRLGVIGLLSAALAIVTISVAMRFAGARYAYVTPDDVPQADAAIVLGASVVRGAPSPILAARAEEAALLYRRGTVRAIIVTGDSREKSYDEVTPVRDYLLAAGIPSTAIFLDREGFDTYRSMYRARAVFGARRVVIVTQDFHLPRAMFLARSLGIEAYGLVAPSSNHSTYAYAREIAASVKAVWDVARGWQLSFAAAPVDLAGDGRTTW